MTRGRIAITGLGSVNALGVGVAAFDAGLRGGRCGIGMLTRFSTAGYRSACAAEAPELAGMDTPLRSRRSRTTMLALAAADEAWRMAAPVDGTRAGVVLGTSTGGMASFEHSYRAEVTGARERSPLADRYEAPVAVAGDAVAELIGSRGPRLTVSTACSSGANALGIAAAWIRAGRATAVLCGGAESLCITTYAGFNALQAMDPEPCRPFDRRRAGLSLGEGAAMFVLEQWDVAAARGAHILAELLGFGVSADAHHLTQPRADAAGAVLAMRRSFADAGIAADEIDYINAHGTGTLLNDAMETRAIKDVLGARAYRIPVSSTKSQVGHCLAAAGAIEALATVLALRGDFAPPTATLVEPDAECDLDYVPGRARPAVLRIALTNAYGFGGNNTSLVLRRVEAS
ncbi:MAG: beta-ketoacyl synthase [Candidatus Binatia bacterium]